MERDIQDIMEFIDFIQEVTEKLPDYLPQYEIEAIKKNTVNKGNGVIYTGISVLCAGENIGPFIYMDEYFDRYKNGADMDKLMNEISMAYNRARAGMENKRFNINLPEMKDNIFIRVINYEMNKDMLQNCPYVRKEDLAITFRMLINYDDNGIASALIDNNIFAGLDMSRDELLEKATENTARIFPADIRSMESVLKEMSGIDLGAAGISGEPGMYVLTNNTGINGASCMFYDGMLDKAKTMIGDFYILPSSIHEVILLRREENMDACELQMMVEEINRSIVDEKEVLSDSVYEYDEKSKELNKVIGRDEPEQEKGREI